MASKPPTLNEAGKRKISKLLNDTVDADLTPAVFLGATTAERPLYLDCAGDIVFGSPDSGKVDLDTTVQLYSATKLVTTVACLQLVDQGLASLDDPETINKHLPELAELQILKEYTDGGEAILEDQNPKGALTLRLLLSHTSGLAYVWGDPLAKWMTDNGKRHTGFLAADASLDDFTYPLVFQPGTDWQYGIGLDWAAFLVERITGESIKDYFQKNIFEPCGMTSTGFLPTPAIKEKLMRMTFYDPEQKVRPFDNSFTGGILPRPEDADAIGPVLSGGAGLFGTAKDYLAFLRGILASSIHLQTPSSTTKPLLSDASFQELFKDVLSAKGKESLVKMMTTQTFHAPELVQEAAGKHVGHSVGLCLNLIDTSIGRKAGSGCWDGAAKTQYWLDPETGIAGVCFTNVFAMGPCPFIKFYNEYETALYKALEGSE